MCCGAAATSDPRQPVPNRLPSGWIILRRPRRFTPWLWPLGTGCCCALLLVVQRHQGLLPLATLPRNEWTGYGELLLDPVADADQVLDALVAGLMRLPFELLWLQGVPRNQEPRWRAFAAAVRASGHVARHPRPV